MTKIRIEFKAYKEVESFNDIEPLITSLASQGINLIGQVKGAYVVEEQTEFSEVLP